ncbi:bifunctional transaldolase/phosoglucose isomerase [Anaerolineales bacterium HSG24]|nr:bifunctional transaldolase/phosoglucose isomerase [Anaerolineales bacterium HSG24]
MSENSLKNLSELGQSLWYDNIERSLLTGGKLASLVNEDYVMGVTSNPSIFQNAIGKSQAYDAQLEAILAENPTIGIKDLYEALAIEDIQEAADILQPVYDRTNGDDGYISLEVSPELAHDTDGTIAEAKRLFETVGRSNLMIKIPATQAGLPAISEVIGSGINVNVTLMFSLQNYIDVVNAYIEGLEKLDAAGGDLSQVASVASFFISRVDALLDKLLDETGHAEAATLQGKLAIVNAKVVYLKFKEIFESEKFQKLVAKGARVQRPLWASTSTKNPAYSDVLYIEELIGPQTVNTAPPATIEQFKDHGQAQATLEVDLEDAPAMIEKLVELGVDYDSATKKLQDDGVVSFANAFVDLLGTLEEKRETIVSKQVSRMEMDLGEYQNSVDIRLKAWDAAQVHQRVWDVDGTVWVPDPDLAAQTNDLTNRLGWLNIATDMLAQIDTLTEFAQEVKTAGFQQVVLLGMGGSSLAPELFMTTFGAENGLPLIVLDSTNPDQVISVTNQLADVGKTLFVVSSKSGGTLETISFYKHFFNLVKQQSDTPGQNFVAITDPGSKLELIATEQEFRRVFLAPADVGGRYSALTYFGLVPAALVGVDLGKLLRRAISMAQACQAPSEHNPGLQLGATLGELALVGRDKMTLFASPQIEALGNWVEQLVAESTGKHGVGILPVVGEAIAEPAAYQTDRLFVYLRMLGDDNAELDGRMELFRAAGHPVILIEMDELEDFGQEFFRWEMATATASAVLKINPFDQPNVESAKVKARELMAEFDETGSLPSDSPTLDYDDIDAYGPVMGKTVNEALKAFVQQAQAGDYIAIMAYLPTTPETDAALNELRIRLRDGLRVATTVGYGPRFLHSTGQLHKGDGNKGLFIQLTHAPASDVEIPGESYSFATLVAAQAQGDYNALQDNNRRLIRFHIEQADIPDAIRKLIPA